jgi:ketopantoate hydroxymethyltransferase
MLGWGTIRPPRFVPVLARVATVYEDAIRRYVQDVTSRRYPGPEHVYHMRTPAGEAGQ